MSSDCHHHLVPLTHSRTLVAGISMAKAKTKHWVVFLSESGANFYQGSRAELKGLVGAKASKYVHFLAINKPGVRENKIDHELFETSFRRETRIADALQAMKVLVPKNSRIHLVGYSEGAYLAPQIAKRDKRVETLSLIGGGTRGWMTEEFNMASKSKKKGL